MDIHTSACLSGMRSERDCVAFGVLPALASAFSMAFSVLLAIGGSGGGGAAIRELRK